MKQNHNTFSSDNSRTIINNIIAKVGRVSKHRHKFIEHILILFLMIRGRRNFTNATRYGFYQEYTYRRQFTEPFDWLAFNTELIKQYCGDEKIIVFDPSYLPKSRKKTAHVGYFWSGVLGKAIRGLEIGGLGVVDITAHTAYSLEAVQTPNNGELKEQGKTLLSHYTQVVINRKNTLAELSKYLVVDGYFGKKPFVDAVLTETNLSIIGKLRKDASLKYLYAGKQKHKGRPRVFDGVIDLSDLREDVWVVCYGNESVVVKEAIIWSVGLKRKIKIVLVQDIVNSKNYRLLFSTETKLAGEKIFRYYSARFQIEFLFRDAKQYAGLTHSEARSEEKIHFHTNASLTAVNVAKATHRKTGESLSLHDIGIAYFNEFYLSVFFSRFEIDPNTLKNTSAYQDIMQLGMFRE
jgi:hypothetical protein